MKKPKPPPPASQDLFDSDIEVVTPAKNTGIKRKKAVEPIDEKKRDKVRSANASLY